MTYEQIVPLYVDSTIMNGMRSCQTLAKWQTLYNLRPNAKSIDLHAGGCFATALEVLYKSLYAGEDRETAIAKTEFAFTKKWGDFIITKETAKTQDRMWIAVLAYLDKFNPPYDHLEPAFDVTPNPFEFSFAIPLDRETTGIDFPRHPSGEPFIYCGRFDALVRYGGMLGVRDDKTTSALGASWGKKWDLRAQFLGYTWALRVLGHSVRWAIPRGVAILKTKIEFAEVPKEYPEHLIDHWLNNTKKTLGRFVQAYETQDFDMDLGDHCTSYGGCPYIDLCKSNDPEKWFPTYEVVVWNPLAKDDAEILEKKDA